MHGQEKNVGGGTKFLEERKHMMAFLHKKFQSPFSSHCLRCSNTFLGVENIFELQPCYERLSTQHTWRVDLTRRSQRQGGSCVGVDGWSAGWMDG
jgi:hypothetical protein